MKLLLFFTIIFLNFLSGANFNCTKASTRVEKMICADAELSQLDSDMGKTYKKVFQMLEKKNLLLDTQRMWLKEREACETADCISKSTKERITEIEGFTQNNYNSSNLNEKTNIKDSSSKLDSVEKEFYSAYDQYYKDSLNYLEKYAVKKTDTLSLIEEKYKNVEKLFQEKLIDAEKLKNQYLELQASKYSSYRMSDKFVKKYSLSIITKMEEPYVLYIKGFGSFDHTRTLEKYQSYLKTVYESYDNRQIDMAKEIENKKKENEEKTRQLSEEKQIQQDREKVRVECQNWLNKAKQDVYNLGVGEEIVPIRNGKAVGKSRIDAVERNTFLVGNYTLWNTYERYYIEKTECIPYKALKTAPSPYCYR